jgi:hypothetical protein
VPSIAAIKERCEYLIREGRGNESAHLVVWDEEIKQRRETKEKTRVQFETDSHDMYMAFIEEIHRIIKHVGNKAMALGMLLDWIKQLTNPVLDRLMAQQEGPE